MRASDRAARMPPCCGLNEKFISEAHHPLRATFGEPRCERREGELCRRVCIPQDFCSLCGCKGRAALSGGGQPEKQSPHTKHMLSFKSVLSVGFLLLPAMSHMCLQALFAGKTFSAAGAHKSVSGMFIALRRLVRSSSFFFLSFIRRSLG